MILSGRLLLAVFASALLAACDDAPSETTKKSTNGSSSRAANPGPDSQMVAAVSASRSSLIVGVHFALGGQPVVGKPLTVDIAVIPQRAFDSVSGHFDNQEGLKVTSGFSMSPQLNVSAGKVLAHKLELHPTREGVFMISAAIETVSDEGTITRIYSIPVIVQGSSAAAAATPADSAKP